MRRRRAATTRPGARAPPMRGSRRPGSTWWRPQPCTTRTRRTPGNPAAPQQAERQRAPDLPLFAAPRHRGRPHAPAQRDQQDAGNPGPRSAGGHRDPRPLRALLPNRHGASPAQRAGVRAAHGRKRYEVLIAKVGRRVAKDRRLAAKVLQTIPIDQPDLFAPVQGRSSPPPTAKRQIAGQFADRGRPTVMAELALPWPRRRRDAAGRCCAPPSGRPSPPRSPIPASIEVDRRPRRQAVDRASGHGPEVRRRAPRSPPRPSASSASSPPTCGARSPTGPRSSPPAPRDRGALRGRDAAGGAGALLCRCASPPACSARLRRLRVRARHVRALQAQALALADGRAQGRPRRRRHQFRQDDARQCAARGNR